MSKHVGGRDHNGDRTFPHEVREKSVFRIPRFPHSFFFLTVVRLLAIDLYQLYRRSVIIVVLIIIMCLNGVGTLTVNGEKDTRPRGERPITPKSEMKNINARATMSSRAAATPCDVAACGARKRGEQIRCRRWCCSGRQRRSSAHPRRPLYKPYNTYIIYQRHNGSPEVVADRRLFRKRLRATYFFNINIFLVGEKKNEKINNLSVVIVRQRLSNYYYWRLT